MNNQLKIEYQKKIYRLASQVRDLARVDQEWLILAFQTGDHNALQDVALGKEEHDH
jgi:hypothetical protein